MKDDGSACLADIGLMSTFLLANNKEIFQGSCRWMAPELLEKTVILPSKFHLTRESDCYAFGMVIYEVTG